MNAKLLSRVVLGSFLIGSFAQPANAEILEIGLESGAVWQHRNDAKITPQNGTFFEFDQFNQGAFLHARANIGLRLSDSHHLRLVYAPFDISVTGRNDRNINFNGSTFTSNQDVTVNYQFNSYRLGYVYRYADWLHLGFTGKIRDARIQLVQGSLSNEYTNTGFVPLFYLGSNINLGSGFSIFTDMDFAAAPQGRAFDFTLKVRKDFSDSVAAGLGVRSLEGGADNDSVFTFSWFNYAVAELIIRL